MDVERAKARLEGCYITVPTMFRDPDLELDLDATRRVVRFLLERGINQRYGTLLAGGAAGDFSTMTFDERLRVAEAVVAESDGRVPVAMGRPDHQHPRAEAAGQGCRTPRGRVHPGLATILLRPYRS
jgi:dihydrodipicolinate synthase/N-acetylneuraminate lyase